MKSFILTLSFAIATVYVAFAQDGAKPSVVPARKSIMVELNAHPFSETGVFSLDRLQAKYWLSDRFVLRAGFEYDQKRNNLRASDYDPDELYKDTYLERTNLFGIHAGLEYRILKNAKISPYVGLDLSYRRKSTHAEYVSNSLRNNDLYVTYEELDGGWAVYEMVYSSYFGIYYQLAAYDMERAFREFAFNMLFGTDFYFVKNMYLGFELGLAYNNRVLQKVELETITDYTGNPSSNKKTVLLPQRTQGFKFMTNTSIRFGVWF